MDALLGRRPISVKALFDFSKIDAVTKKHLKNVYASLAISTLAAAAGAAVHLYTAFLKGGLLASLGSIGFLLALGLTSNEPKNQLNRLGYLVGFALCTGLGLGPLLEHVIAIDPRIISTAFFATTLIFVCFSLAALWAEERSYLYLGGTLGSALSLMCVMGLVNLFFRSSMMYQLHLYGGLLVFCGFILYDTQLIIEKKRNGDGDFIWHSVDLFLDFINIFRRILIILSNKEEKKRKSKN
jgi:FtsH-binding integral membrane protein